MKTHLLLSTHSRARRATEDKHIRRLRARATVEDQTTETILLAQTTRRAAHPQIEAEIEITRPERGIIRRESRLNQWETRRDGHTRRTRAPPINDTTRHRHPEIQNHPGNILTGQFYNSYAVGYHKLYMPWAQGTSLRAWSGDHNI